MWPKSRFSKSFQWLELNFYYCLMSSSIRHLFLGLFSTKSILSASLSSRGSLQLSSFSPSPSPSSSCFLFAVASSAACLLRHFVRRFWNQTWWWKKNYWRLIIKNLNAYSKSQNKSLNRAFIWNGLFSIFHCHLIWCRNKGRGNVKKTEEGLKRFYLHKWVFSFPSFCFCCCLLPQLQIVYH